MGYVNEEFVGRGGERGWGGGGGEERRVISWGWGRRGGQSSLVSAQINPVGFTPGDTPGGLCRGG